MEKEFLKLESPAMSGNGLSLFCHYIRRNFLYLNSHFRVKFDLQGFATRENSKLTFLSDSESDSDPATGTN